jgi:hypothetical protein
MVETWLSVFQTKAAEWNIPPARVTDLTAALAAAKEIPAVVKSGERTAASVVEYNEIFKEMEARFIKKHFLLIPPLTLADLPALLLPLPDDTHTPVPPPAGQPALTITYLGGPHVQMVHLVLMGYVFIAATLLMLLIADKRCEQTQRRHNLYGPAKNS